MNLFLLVNRDMYFSMVIDNQIFFFTGLITTTSRKLDREQQAEHFLEVRLSGKYILQG